MPKRKPLIKILYCLIIFTLIVIAYVFFRHSAKNNNHIDVDLKIEKIIHLSWKTEYIPFATIKWVKRWQDTNPDWEVWFWDDTTAGNFVRIKFSHLLHVYDAYNRQIYRIDMLRYLILWEYGGVWADLDIEPLKSLNPIREQYPCILSQEHAIHTRKWNMPYMACNAYMMCRKHHPFFSLIIEMLETNQKNDYPITATGPIMITRMYDVYTKMHDVMMSVANEDRVFLADVDMFMPRVDIQSWRKLMKACDDGSIRNNYKYLCEEAKVPGYIHGPVDTSYVDHHWLHSWLGNKTFHDSKKLNDVLPNVVYPRRHGIF